MSRRPALGTPPGHLMYVRVHAMRLGAPRNRSSHCCLRNDSQLGSPVIRFLCWKGLTVLNNRLLGDVCMPANKVEAT